MLLARHLIHHSLTGTVRFDFFSSRARTACFRFPLLDHSHNHTFIKCLFGALYTLVNGVPVYKEPVFRSSWSARVSFLPPWCSETCFPVCFLGSYQPIQNPSPFEITKLFLHRNVSELAKTFENEQIMWKVELTKVCRMPIYGCRASGC